MAEDLFIDIKNESGSTDIVLPLFLVLLTVFLVMTKLEVITNGIMCVIDFLSATT